MRILLVSDIHGNYPALRAVSREAGPLACRHVLNCGDSTVYAPFPNEVLDWLRRRKAISIRGNTDDRVIRLLKGRNFARPGSLEKRVMYYSTAAVLSPENRDLLLGLKKRAFLTVRKLGIGLFHGSPADHEEFLFDDTPEERFRELAALVRPVCRIVVTGHSHTPFYRQVAGVHFINPGSVGRMFDGRPEASYGLLSLGRDGEIEVDLRRCAYDVETLARALAKHRLPAVYQEMYRTGTKRN